MRGVIVPPALLGMVQMAIGTARQLAIRGAGAAAIALATLMSGVVPVHAADTPELFWR